MPNQDLQTIDQLTQRYSKLNDARVRAQTNLEHAQKQLDDLEQKAKDAFGTSDLEKLKQKLTSIESENEKRLAEYQKHLDAVESELARVEQEFSGESE